MNLPIWQYKRVGPGFVEGADCSPDELGRISELTAVVRRGERVEYREILCGGCVKATVLIVA